ncbi:hypothetical protein PN4B1_17120 [Paenibacillus naphthalenovorans]|uniref:lytic transglycosylase domain-containing protein n=1 Tax=Paenibacillus naphthalenovorans TaxID=162209 RepID=UPI0010B86633|nr:lytic transglycosylase domain-containing protein [Paenibacillus naphthalenovorans]GCL71807.1 hypothetical protein PN4B1_17120 [Paenibacillus naphthalenovorans]
MPQAYRGAFESAAGSTGLPVDLLGAIAKTESNFNPSAKSKAGAYGIMQLMPGTAKELGVDPRDPAQNVMGGARYIKSMIDQFGSVELGLAAYNAGPGNLRKAIRQAGSTNWNDVKKYLPKETQNYVPKVLANRG